MDDREGKREWKHYEIHIRDCHGYLQAESHLGYPRKHLGNLENINYQVS